MMANNVDSLNWDLLFPSTQNFRKWKKVQDIYLNWEVLEIFDKEWGLCVEIQPWYYMNNIKSVIEIEEVKCNPKKKWKERASQSGGFWATKIVATVSIEQSFEGDTLKKLPLRAHGREKICTFNIRLPDKNWSKAKISMGEMRKYLKGI